MKRCSKCGKLKSLMEFHMDISKISRIQSQCKKCRNKINIEYYKKNRDQSKKRVKEYRKKIKKEAIATYGGKCQNKECPYPDINTDSNYLEFHHKEGHSEVIEGSKTTYRRIVKHGIQDDVDLLCAPCHKMADIKDGTYISHRNV